MIFVALGTQDKQFKRLLEAVDNIDTTHDVIVQKGSTEYEFQKLKPKAVYDYLPGEQFRKYIEEADIIITHAGVGTIIRGVQMHKKMIVAPRLKKYQEHVNDHQLEILKTFENEGYIIPLYDFSKLNEEIEKINDFEPKEFVSNNEYFNEALRKEIEA